jgi:diguanylate cyclase (GGDEF)-like protein
VSSDSLKGNDYLPGAGLQRIVSSDDPGSCSRRLTRDQRQALLEVRQKVNRNDQPREFLYDLVNQIGQVVQAKVGVAGKSGSSWVVAAESASEPSIQVHTNGGPHPFDRISATPGHRVELWRTSDRDWTLVCLASRPNPPVILIIDGDWTACALVWRDLARSFSVGNFDDDSSERTLAAISQHLTRALADTSGLASVGEVVLHHVVQAVPSRMASLAVAAADGDLSIVATHGYPRALVEHLRIPAGSGVIGAVHLSRMPLLVPDVTATPGLDRHRSRYRTRSFAAVPIVAGAESLGVVSLTDRSVPGPYTVDDLNALAVLLAPAALALGRERVWREAQAYAQAAVIDPVSGLFNRRYFQARLDEELQRAIRQLTSVGLLMVDLDGFKSINDRFGHVAGDLVIRDISEILRRSVRIFDVCTRFGGEEFAVMMPGGTAESAGAIAERIRQRVEAYQRSESDLADLKVTASIGVAVSPPGVTARDLIERADRALYHAKKGGKNRVSTAAGDGTVLPA